MPCRESPFKLERLASKAVAMQVLYAGLKIDSLPDRHDLTANTQQSGCGSAVVHEQELSPFHSTLAKDLTTNLATFLQQMPVALLEKVVNDIEFGGEEDDDVMERKLMTTIIKLHESRLSDLSYGLHAILCALTKTNIKKLNFNERCLARGTLFDDVGNSFVFSKTINRCLIHFESLTYCNLSHVADDKHLIALSNSCPNLEFLKLDESRVSPSAYMYLAGLGKEVRRKLLDDNSAPRRTGCFNLCVLSVGYLEVSKSSLRGLLKNCPKLTEIRGCDILDSVSTKPPFDLSQFQSKSLRCFGMYPPKFIGLWKSVIETFPNVKEVTIIEDKQLDVLHEKELTQLTLYLKNPPTNSSLLFMSSRAAANLTELVFILTESFDYTAGKHYTLKTLQLAQRHCKNLRILEVGCIGKAIKPGTREKLNFDTPLPSSSLRFLERLCIQHTSKSLTFDSDEEDYILETIAGCETLQVLRLTGNYKNIDEDVLEKLCERNPFANLTELNINVPNVVFSMRSFRTLMKLPKIKRICISRSEHSVEDVLDMLSEIRDNRYLVEILGVNKLESTWRTTDYNNDFAYFS